MWKDGELPVGYKRVESISFDSNFYYNTNEKLYGSDVVTMTIDDFVSSGQNLFGCYSGAEDDVINFSLYIYGTSSGGAYWRYNKALYRPVVGGTEKRTITFGAGGTTGFKTNVSYDAQEFETTDVAYIGALPNSVASKFKGTIIGNITVGNRLKYIPCIRESDNAIGYYELMNRNFLEARGSGTPIAGATDITHMTLEVVGTSEEISISASGTTLQTVSAVSLFGTNDYQDTQDIITGAVVRNVGIKVLDGTEDWVAHSNVGTYRYSLSGKRIEKSPFFSTHFAYSSGASSKITDGEMMCGVASTNCYFCKADMTTLADFKAWLASQYAAGTPVIVLYPLAEPTTEQTTPQHLSTVKGDNLLTVTAEVDNITFDVTYTKKQEK